MADRRNHLRYRIRVHIHRLNGDERTNPFSILDDDLRQGPGVQQPVVRVDEDAFAAGGFAPPCDSNDLVEIRGAVDLVGWRTRRERAACPAETDTIDHAGG